MAGRGRGAPALGSDRRHRHGQGVSRSMSTGTVSGSVTTRVSGSSRPMRAAATSSSTSPASSATATGRSPRVRRSPTTRSRRQGPQGGQRPEDVGQGAPQRPPVRRVRWPMVRPCPRARCRSGVLVRAPSGLGLASLSLACAPAASGAGLIEVGLRRWPTRRRAVRAHPASPSRGPPATRRRSAPARALRCPRTARSSPGRSRSGSPGPSRPRSSTTASAGPRARGSPCCAPAQAATARVAGKSPIQRLEPCFGRAVKFPLGRSLRPQGLRDRADRADVGAGPGGRLGNDTSWRASRGRGSCQETGRQTAQMRLGHLSRDECLYRTARLTYSATLIPTPRPGSAEG